MHYHIVGIAGAGMSAIAHILRDQGHSVSGSDLSANRQTADLAARGMLVHAGHDPAYVDGADAIVTTSAVRPDHPELAAARARSIPILKRADLWRDWSQQRYVIAIAGTHGKTTTTALMALMCTRAGLNPGFLIGGEAPDLERNARWGDANAPLVLEADEYDRTFLALLPEIAVVTNVEWDHPDIYPTATEYNAAFAQFIAQTRAAVVLGGGWSSEPDDCSTKRLTYGLEAGNDYQATKIAGSTFTVRHSTFQLRVPGLHNIHNALAVIVVADLLGIDHHVVAAALGEFRGTARRFEIKGEVAGITVIDDYAHHPTEVRATLAAARSSYGARRIVAYLQPHTYSRTSALLEQWPAAFADADIVLVGDVYAAREQGDPAATSGALTERIAGMHSQVRYVGNVAAAAATALELLRPGDVLLTLGAGDGNQAGEQVLKQLGTGGQGRGVGV